MIREKVVDAEEVQSAKLRRKKMRVDIGDLRLRDHFVDQSSELTPVRTPVNFVVAAVSVLFHKTLHDQAITVYIRAAEAIDRMAHYLGLGTSVLVTSFAPSIIIVVGEVSRMWSRLGPVVDSVVAERSPLASGTRIIALDEFAYPRLRGAVSLVLQKHFVAPTLA